MRRIGRLRSEASPSNTAVIGQPATAPMHQPAAGAGIAEIERAGRLGEAGDADAVGRARRRRRVRSTWAPSARMRLRGVEHVLAFEQAGDPGLADRERAENQRADARSTCRPAPAHGL